MLFDFRLGALLGKSLREVRSLSYKEWHMWYAYFQIEPWGWHNMEYHAAQLMAQIFNVNVRKRSQRKKPTFWVRNMVALVTKAIHRYKYEKTREEKNASQNEIDLQTAEGRKQATETIIKQFESMFGKRVVRKDK